MKVNQKKFLLRKKKSITLILKMEARLFVLCFLGRAIRMISHYFIIRL